MKLTPPYSDPVLKFVAITPKVTAVMSLIGVTYIIWHIVRSPKRRQRPYHRLLLSMSIQDWLFSWRCFASTWAVPAQHAGIYANIGNHATCTAAGFIGQATAVSSALYNGSLAVYFLLSIVYGWSDRWFRQKARWVEWVLHGVPLVVGWGTATLGLALDLYHSIGWSCWIAPAPGDTATDPHNIQAYRWAMFFSAVWTVFCVTTVVLVMIYTHIWRQEQAMVAYEFSSSSSTNNNNVIRNHTISIPQRESSVASLPSANSSGALAAVGATPTITTNSARNNDTNNHNTSTIFNNCHQHKLSKRFATQAALYVGAYFLAYIFPLVMFHLAVRRGQFYAPLLMALVVFLPLQGFFDAAIYLRPRYLAYRDRQDKERLLELQLQQQAEEQNGNGDVVVAAAAGRRIRRDRGPSMRDRVAAIVHVLSHDEEESGEQEGITDPSDDDCFFIEKCVDPQPQQSQQQPKQSLRCSLPPCDEKEELGQQGEEDATFETADTNNADKPT